LSKAESVRRFYDAFNSEDLGAFAATLHPHVELQTARGLKLGRDEASAWATRAPDGHLHQRIVIEELVEHHNHIVALIRKQWWWDDGREPAHDEELATVFTFKDGLISRCQPFTDRAEALRVAGVED
jgi:ketosteroid isomerase-like protein